MPKFLARIELLFMFGNYHRHRPDQRRIRQCPQCFRVSILHAVRRIDKHHVGRHMLPLHPPKRPGQFFLQNLEATPNPQAL